MKMVLFNKKDSQMDRLALGICTGVFFFWFLLLSYKYQHYGYYDWDLAISDQVVWDLCHGSAFSSLIGYHFLANHANYIAFLIAPVYYFFPHPLTLIFLKLFSFAGGSFVLYKIIDKFWDKRLALIVMLLYITHPANIFMLFYEFKFENLAVGIIFLLFYFFQIERLTAFLITAFILMLIKENMSLIVVLFGLYGLLTKKEKRGAWGALPLFLGVSFFVVTMAVIIPFIRRPLPFSESIYWSLYGHFTKIHGSFIKTVSFYIFQLFSVLFSKQNLIYLYDLFGPFLFFALASCQVLLLGLPILFQNLLSKAYQMHTIYFHYSATIVPLIAIAAGLSLGVLRSKFHILTYRILCFLSGLIFLFNVYHFGPMWQDEIAGWVNKPAKIRDYLIQQIPKEAGVVASFDFLSHLDHRKNLYSFYNVLRNINYITGQEPFALPKDVQYALIDFNDPWFLPSNNSKIDNNHLKDFFSSGHWIVQRQYGSIILFKRRG